ncbi:MAG: hypothetical protein ACLP50_04970 [Solirubrobacteraceae bacterium]
MIEQAPHTSTTSTLLPASDARTHAARRRGVTAAPRWLPVGLAVVGVAVVIVLVTGMRPGYDAFGWLVWGRQALHWNLNTDGAPSWKPLTILFTLPYALAGRTQMSLWTVTAVAGALLGPVFAGRVAYRLTGPATGRRRAAPGVAAALAAFGVLGIGGYAHQILIADSDPIVVALCLGAIDCHLRDRPRPAFALLVLASLGRPEAWPFALVYGAWLWRSASSSRVLVVLGVALIPALWFSVPAATSRSWFESGELALRTINPDNVIHGSKIIGVLDRFGSLYEVPMQIAVAGAIALAVAVRDRRMLALAGAAAIWLALEVALALRGWSAAARYMFEPAAVLVVLVGAAVGRALAFAPAHPRAPVGRAPAFASVLRRAAGWIGPLAVLGLVAALVPVVGARVRTTHAAIQQARGAGRQVDRLQAVVGADGGAARIRACGQPITFVGNQSAVAWAVGLNVGDVGFTPGRSIAGGEPVVLFRPRGHGWQVRPFNVRRPDRAGCAALRLDSSSN